VVGLPRVDAAPLAGGRLFTANDARSHSLRNTLETLAAELGVTATTVVIAWVMRHPSAPLPILGSRRIAVAREAMAAQGLPLDDAAWWRICAAAAEPAAV
jgi:predicted oxidoreductase